MSQYRDAHAVQTSLDGLAQVQLKVRMLEEDRDYHSNLQRSSEREYNHHRAQLDELLRKERRVHHERETALTRTLAHLHDEAAMLRRALEESMEQHARTCERIRREEDSEREARDMRARADLAAAQNEANQREEELAALLRTVQELREQRERKMARVSRLEADQRKLNVQLNSASRKVPKGKVAHPFLPAGPTNKLDRVGMPSSQNVHSFSQTWQRAAMRTPGADSPLGRRSPGRATRSAVISGELEKKLKADLRSLYKQCSLLANRISSEAGDAAADENGSVPSANSAQLRSIFAAIDQKQRQLADVRTAGNRLAPAETMDQVQADAEDARIAAEATHAALLNALRTSSFVPERD